LTLSLSSYLLKNFNERSLELMDTCHRYPQDKPSQE
jgi:hypothetical protein